MPDTILDAATLSILWGRLNGICDEAATTLVRTSFSPVVQECNDYCCALMDRQGRSIAENSIGVPAFIGTVARTTRAILVQRPPASWAPGDVLVTNDPWIGTGHLLDFTVVMPLFHASRLIGFSGTVAHAVDIGGLSWSAHAHSVFEEGVRFPILPLMRAGVLNEDLLAILKANVRQPDLVFGDLMAQVAACETGIRRTQELLDDTGLTDFERLAAELQSRTEAAMGQAIRNLPEGSYKSEVVVDGKEKPLAIRCLLTVRDGELSVDYDGTSPQVDWGINSPLNYTYAYTAYPLKCALDPHTPKNEGSYRPIRVTAPEGSMLSPRDPAPVSGRHLTGMFCASAVYQALAQACPERVTADSSGPPARPVLTTSEEEGSARSLIIFAWGGMGARADADGLACTAFPGNDNCASVEIMEATAPVRFLRKELIPDSGGAGRYRGGLGQEIAFEFLGRRPAMLSLMSARHTAAPAGLLGGWEGTRTEFLINGRPGAVNASTKIFPGDMVTVRFPGAGGYGPPQLRDPVAVARDVANGLVSDHGADAAHGTAWRSASFTVRS